MAYEERRKSQRGKVCAEKPARKSLRGKGCAEKAVRKSLCGKVCVENTGAEKPAWKSLCAGKGGSYYEKRQRIWKLEERQRTYKPETGYGAKGLHGTMRGAVFWPSGVRGSGQGGGLRGVPQSGGAVLRWFQWCRDEQRHFEDRGGGLWLCCGGGRLCL